MIEAPPVEVSCSPEPAWSAEGPLAQRALAFAHSFAATLPPGSLPPQRLVVDQAPTEHCGLGTGTQLGLAVAKALALAARQGDLDACTLARRIGRGHRSAVGVHGFEQGGFLVEGGQRAADVLAPLLARVAFPEDWRIVLAFPKAPPGRHGNDESQVFDRWRARGPDTTHTEALCRLVLLGFLPALLERDFRAFGEALHDFNARSGERWAAIQGGTYASPGIAEMVAAIQQLGIRGVGQSSWGPTLFALVEDEGQARALETRLRCHSSLRLEGVLITRGYNQGAKVVSSQ
jgi:beta-RFAP synthase